MQTEVFIHNFFFVHPVEFWGVDPFVGSIQINICCWMEVFHILQGVPRLVPLLGCLYHSPRLIEPDFLLGGDSGMS